MNIAIWYHCKIRGIGIPNERAANQIVKEQMDALQNSGLADAASEIHIGINGTQQDAMKVGLFAPDKSFIYCHGSHSRSELPTFSLLRQWLKDKKNWFVFYHHSKGVTNPKDTFKHIHRRTMEKYLVWNWKQCVNDLELGFDAVGINIVHPIKRPVLPEKYFAGNFWWSNTDYMKRLPPLPDNITHWNNYERCMAERWILSLPSEPRLMDYERPELYQSNYLE